MPKRTLTDVGVKRLKPPSAGQTEYFDAGYPGLALRLSHGGTKAWVYLYRLHGKQARLSLGRYPEKSLAEAREAWRAARELVAKGETPRLEKASLDDTFEAVADEWLRRDQAGNRSVVEVRRVIERDVLPAWRGRIIHNIKRRDCIDVIDGIADRGATTLARRIHAHLHRLFRWAVGRGIIEINPMADLPKPGVAVKRDRVLSDAELSAVWRAAAETSWPFGPLLHLLILTGARRDEITALRWSEIDGNTIRLAGGRTKNGEPHNIPFSQPAAEIIESLPHVEGSDLVFTTTGTTPISGFSKAKTLLDNNAAELHGKPLPPWRVHDIRRTVATNLQRLGASLQVIESVLGHIGGSRAGIVGVYQRHEYSDEKRKALDQWADRLADIVATNKPSKASSHRSRKSLATDQRYRHPGAHKAEAEAT